MTFLPEKPIVLRQFVPKFSFFREIIAIDNEKCCNTYVGTGLVTVRTHIEPRIPDQELLIIYFKSPVPF